MQSQEHDAPGQSLIPHTFSFLYFRVLTQDLLSLCRSLPPSSRLPASPFSLSSVLSRRQLLSDVGLIHLSRVLANGVLRDSEIRRLKNLAVQCRSQLDLEEMRTMEAERKLRASLAQTLSLRSQNRVFRWYILQNKLMAVSL